MSGSWGWAGNRHAGGDRRKHRHGRHRDIKFNALPLIPLFFLFWYLQHLSRVEIGLTWGH